MVLVYAFPGYMNFDVGAQLFEIRKGPVTDFHPPMMGGYWRIFEVFVSGPFPMLLLQTSLFLWGLYTLLCLRLSKQQAAWVAAAIVIFPPVLSPLAMIWKDAQMSAFLMAGAALTLKPSWPARALGMLLFVAATGIRFNGATALPFLCLGATWVAWQAYRGTWSMRERVVATGIAAALTLGAIFVAGGINRALTERRAYNWYRTTAIFDIVGTTCFAPPLSDQQVLEILDGIKLVETANIQRLFCERYPAGKRENPPPWYSYSELFDWHPTKADRLARKRAWLELVRTYPMAYLEHRATIAMDMLGMGGARLWEPVGQDFAANEEHLRRVSHDHRHSWFQRTLGGAFRWLAEHTFLYRAYVYVFFSLLFFGWALVKRDLLVGSITGSGLLYELSLAIGVNAPDFRYSHWMISCTCLAAVFVAVARWRSRPGSSAGGAPRELRAE